MTELIQNHFEVIRRMPAIPLGNDKYVSRSSKKRYSPEGAYEWCIKKYNAPLVTGDLAVRTRNLLDQSPLKDIGLDSSADYQRVSDIWGFHVTKKGSLWTAVSDLPRMYKGESLDRQLKASQRIGWGRLMSRKDKHDMSEEKALDKEILERLFDTAGKRKAEITGAHWPHEIPIQLYGADKIALAFLPEEAGTNAEYLTRKGRTTGLFYLLAPSIPVKLKENANMVAVRPCGVGGVGSYDINDVDASDYYIVDGRARAGSVDAKILHRKCR